MPDVRDLLTSAAGEPVTGLDLDDVLRRGARRTARRRTALAAAAAVPLAGAVLALSLTGGSQERVLPGAPVPSPPVASTSPAPAPSPLPSTPVQPSPAPPVTPAASEVFFALLTGFDEQGFGFSYDRIDSRGPGCLGSEPIGAPDLVPACYTNVNPLVRRGTASADTVVVAVDSSGLPLDSDVEQLRTLVRDPGFVGLADRPYELTVEDGVVTRIVAQVYESA